MAFLVPRTCTKVNGNNDPAQSRPLAEFRDAAAYVLLGDPGAGKTSCFKAEAQATDGVFISARDFLTFGADPAWRQRTLFIDGLDETRAGTSDGRVPLDQIRKKLHALGLPRFRLSCREADWLGGSDRSHLNAVASGGEVVALRLDPLHTSQILEILGHRQDASNPQEFLDTARNHGVSELLTNPQTLDLLVKSVGAGQWPENRKDVFELACRELATERNDEHRGATRGAAPPREELLDAAGRLCAMMLLANEPVVSLAEEPGRLSVCDLRDGENVRAALATRLFTGEGGTERFASMHRTVAEYLAARHLAHVVADGLPVGRLLALMTGPDGGVVSSLRGLHAWLAVHCAVQRTRLIDADPLGVVLYGDVRGFSTQDKTRVLRALAGLAGEDPSFRRDSWNTRPFGALCTPDMEQDFRAVLISRSREPAQEALADCVVDALHHGVWLPGLQDVLLTVVREDDRWLAVRCGALEACLKHLPPDHPELLQLLDDLQADRVADDSDELLGTCLTALYPGVITAQRLFDFLHSPKQSRLLGMYEGFWDSRLAERAPTQDVPELLDRLVQRGLPVSKDVGDHRFQAMVGKLLLRGLDEWGDRIDGDRLFEWLAVGLDEHGHPQRDRDVYQQVQQWLSDRPERYRDVADCAIRKLWNSELPGHLRYKSERRAYNASPPADFGRWLLAWAESDPIHERAVELFAHAVINCFYSGRGDEGLSFEFFEDWVSERPEFRARWEGLLYCDIQDWQRDRAEREREDAQERVQARKARSQEFRGHLTEIQAGVGHPENFDILAKAHEGLYFDVIGDSPIERLKDLLNDDAELVLAVLSGLKRVPFRDDLPTVDEIAALEVEGQVHFICLPCLVGAQMLFSDDPDAFLGLPGDVLKRLVAFRLSWWVDDTPDWFTAVALAHPIIFADTLVAYATQLFITDKPLYCCYELHANAHYLGAAKRAIQALIRALPATIGTQRLDDLQTLLRAGLQHVEAGEMIAVIRDRLALDALDAAQRTCLLAAGLLLDEQRYEPMLREFLGQDAERAKHVLGVMHERFGRQGIGVEIPLSVAAVLVELLGSVFPHVPLPSGASWGSREINASDFIKRLIHRLGADPSAQTTHQIAALLRDPHLESWWPNLQYAQQSQRIVYREASYRHPSPTQVQETLWRGKPANVADLAELHGEILRDLAREIRDGNADGYKQFWNLDSHARPTEPRVEDVCRDTLLERLRDRLRILDIDAQPEGRYADDKRADIRVSFGGAAGFNVPVEIKRDRHPDVWRAMHDQLIPQYTRDPGAAGYGIYLVFWFGGAGMPGRPGDGQRPATARELEHQLCTLLNESERRLIQVCVIDVARPRGSVRTPG